jgi:hypothetical protein
MHSELRIASRDLIDPTRRVERSIYVFCTVFYRLVWPSDSTFRMHLKMKHQAGHEYHHSLCADLSIPNIKVCRKRKTSTWLPWQHQVHSSYTVAHIVCSTFDRKATKLRVAVQKTLYSCNTQVIPTDLSADEIHQCNIYCRSYTSLVCHCHKLRLCLIRAETIRCVP